MPKLSSPLESAEVGKELAFSGRLETERLVGALSVVIVLEHPKQQIGYAHPALGLGQGVQQGAEHPVSPVRWRHPGGLDVSCRRSSGAD